MDESVLVWEYDELPSGHPYDWSPAARGDHPDDQVDFHVDLGAGRLPKGRFSIDKRRSENTNWVMDFDDPNARLPFADNSIRSIISHHCLEHVGPGFENLMEECYRVLEVWGIFRIIVPLFPSRTAVEEYDHKRYFMEGTLRAFVAANPEGDSHTELFAEPYNACRFSMTEEAYTPMLPPEDRWGPEDARELRVTLTKHYIGV